MKARGGLRCPWATTATKLCLQTVAKPRGSQRHIQTMNARRTFKINLPDFTWTLAKTESACLLSANISMLRVCWVTSFAQIINITNHTGLFTSSASAAFAATLVEQKALYVRGSFEVCGLPKPTICLYFDHTILSSLHTSHFVQVSTTATPQDRAVKKSVTMKQGMQGPRSTGINRNPRTKCSRLTD